MLKTAKKHHVSFAPLKISENLKDQLPAWLHMGAPPRTYHKTKNNCLRQTHQVTSVKHLRNTAERITNQISHQPQATCTCTDCINDRLAGCKNPHQCAKTAQHILDSLLPKYNPNTTPKKDHLTLTHRRLEKNAQARTQPQGEILFNPSITIWNSLTDCFRIF
ncbi:hypothetical protein EV424DRAFT_1299833, partial [Suillus variegatus]